MSSSSSSLHLFFGAILYRSQVVLACYSTCFVFSSPLDPIKLMTVYLNHSIILPNNRFFFTHCDNDKHVYSFWNQRVTNGLLIFLNILFFYSILWIRRKIFQMSDTKSTRTAISKTIAPKSDVATSRPDSKLENGPKTDTSVKVWCCSVRSCSSCFRMRSTRSGWV